MVDILMKTVRQISLGVYWNTRGKLENSHELYAHLENGWRINRVDELHDGRRPVLMYILEKDVYDA